MECQIGWFAFRQKISSDSSFVDFRFDTCMPFYGMKKRTQNSSRFYSVLQERLVRGAGVTFFEITAC